MGKPCLLLLYLLLLCLSLATLSFLLLILSRYSNPLMSGYLSRMNLAFYEMDYTKFTFRGLLLQLFFYEFVKDREKIVTAVGVRNRLIDYCRSAALFV